MVHVCQAFVTINSVLHHASVFISKDHINKSRYSQQDRLSYSNCLMSYNHSAPFNSCLPLMFGSYLTYRCNSTCSCFFYNVAVKSPYNRCLRGFEMALNVLKGFFVPLASKLPLHNSLIVSISHEKSKAAELFPF